MDLRSPSSGPLHVAVDGQDHGPLDPDVARTRAAEAIRAGKIPTVWAPGSSSWRPATEVWPDLASAQPQVPSVSVQADGRPSYRPGLREELLRLTTTPAASWESREWKTVGVLAAAGVVLLFLWFGIVGTLVGGAVAFFLLVSAASAMAWVQYRGGMRAAASDLQGVSGSASRITTVVVFTLVGLGLGYSMGAYWPVFHELASYAEVGSKARQRVLPGYVVGGGLLGFVGGIVAASAGGRGRTTGGAYHLSIAGRTYPGLSAEKVRELLAAAPTAAQTATVWQEGWTEWKRAGEFFPVPPVS